MKDNSTMQINCRAESFLSMREPCTNAGGSPAKSLLPQESQSL
jgi:hypothetical protein